MYDMNNRQYIFRQTSGKIWRFFHDEKYGLCYSILNKRYAWSDPVVLQKNISRPFYADIDCEDHFHLLFQDRQGNIYHTRMENDVIRTMPVLNSRTPTLYNKHLFLLDLKNNLYVFFIIHHNDTVMLAYQTMNAAQAGTPRVIDYITANENPYAIACSKTDELHIFYQSSDGRHLQLGYRKFNMDANKWGEFNPVTKSDGDCEKPKVLSDSSNILHLCYQRHGSRQYELVYQKKTQDSNTWTEEYVLHSSVYAFDISSFIYVNGTLFVYWLRDDSIYYCSSNDAGSTWSKPAKYNFTAGKQLFCFSYKSNSANEYEKIITPDIPGNFTNGLSLAFYRDMTLNSGELSVEELRNMIVDTLRLLKNSIDELKEANSSLKENMQSLCLAQQNVEKEVVKYSVKLTILENETNYIKVINNKLDAYRSVLGEFKTRFEAGMSELNDIKKRLQNSETVNKTIPKNPRDTRSTRKETGGGNRDTGVKKLSLARDITNRRYIRKII